LCNIFKSNIHYFNKKIDANGNSFYKLFYKNNNFRNNFKCCIQTKKRSVRKKYFKKILFIDIAKKMYIHNLKKH
jgi:hypothetical protein